MAALLAVLLAACPQQKDPAPMPKHTNRLSKEKSPYLLQHAHNPVDWHPWGPEAFAKAKKDDKPIFLSIGYSTCHWCHVMERESFESEDVAAVLNAGFVPVKVDREERPDVDQIYMAAVQAMGQRGGWPLSVWLTPDLKPFMGGTYFPREDRFGRPGFVSVLKRISEVWKGKRAEIEASAGQIADHLREIARVEGGGDVDLGAVLGRGAEQVASMYEPRHGGFSPAPKFPHSTTVQYLLRLHARTGDAKSLEMAEKSLEEMARGGLYDQLGGGFHRYSTDAQWIVPHFEKMLYDNGLLAVAYLEAFQLTRKPLYERIVRETLDYVLRDMTSKEGGFYSAEDADSERIEGKFYVWNPEQVEAVLGKDDAARFSKAYDVTKVGNWEPHEPEIPKHQSVLRLVGQEALPDLKKKLFEARAKRVRPHLDDKVLTSWNALMISAMAKASRTLGEARYRDAAVRAADFLLGAHRKDGALLRTSRLGEAKIPAFLEDHAYFADALLDLYEATFEPRWFEEAQALAKLAVGKFWDSEAGGFFATLKDDALLARMREEHEGAQPPGNAVMVRVLLRLYAFTGDPELRDKADRTVRSCKALLERFPGGQSSLLMALEWMRGPSREIVVAGPEPERLLASLRTRFLPHAVTALNDGRLKLPLFEGKGPVGGKAAAYVCRNMTCERPVTDPDELEALLK
jgi:hypothetical protein